MKNESLWEVDKAIVEGLLALGAVFTSEDAEEAYHEAIGSGGSAPAAEA